MWGNIAAYGNSLSLSGVCGWSTQSPLPRAARRRRSRGREGAGYHEIYVVGEILLAEGKPLYPALRVTRLVDRGGR